MMTGKADTRRSPYTDNSRWMILATALLLLFTIACGVRVAQGGERTDADGGGFHCPMLARPQIDGRFAALESLDLSNMPTGDVLARHDASAIPWRNVNGPDAKKTWQGRKKVEIRDLALKVNWPDPTTKYSGTPFLIKDCEEVLIENVAIVHTNADYRGQHSFLLENCGKVTVRNVYSAGAIGRYHIRLEGCREFLIERVEICGWDYGEGGVRCGGGIFVNNGMTRPDGSVHTYTPNRRELEWGVIRDSWFHDYLAQDGGKWRNQDGIAFHAPSNGLVFNCVFDRWLAGDGAIDDSHRRHDAAYRNKVHRIERCVFRNCRLVKTNGAKGSPDCVIVWANNVYVNAWMGDYHKGWTNWHIHETHLFEEKAPVFVKNWGMRDGLTVFANCLLHAPQGADVVYWQSGKAAKDGYRLFRADRVLYLMPRPAYWMRGLDVTIKDRAAWLSEGLERDCVIVDKPAGFVDRAKGDLRLAPSSPAVAFGSGRFLNPRDAALRVLRDFNGCPRPARPAAGAFEPVQ